MNTILPLEYDTYYHIYNRGNNRENIFRDDENYPYFLKLYDEYITPVAETIAWCLMKNHFHMLIHLYPEEEIGYIKQKEGDKRTFSNKKKYNPSRQFANLFNAYAKAFNKRYKRTGCLFETPFRRIKVKDEHHLKVLVRYIHYNPVKHGFADSIGDYKWSSYSDFISPDASGSIEKNVREIFGSIDEFIIFHNHRHPDTDMETYN
jgi:putative transposase